MFMGFHGIPWDSMRFYDVPVNQSVPTESNRGLTSYICFSTVLSASATRSLYTFSRLEAQVIAGRFSYSPGPKIGNSATELETYLVSNA
jgi:hypothetical protein